MDWFVADGYWLARLVFQRGLAVVYLVAFVAALRQFRGLLGEHGLLPVPEFLGQVPFRRSPSLFHWHYSDRLYAAVSWAGAALASGVVVGLADRVPWWVGTVWWLVLWVLYLSIVNVGQRWYGFGWESLLLEVGFLAAFTGNAHTDPPLLLLVLLRWVLFRLEFGAGLIKLRGDRCWRDLTCLYYHHETQPMPGPFSWWFHHLPRPLHRVEVAANHVTQLVVPFGLFAPQPVAGTCAAIMIVTQLWLVASGNFSWLNWMAIVLALSVLPDRWWAFLLPGSGAHPAWSLPWWFFALVLAATVLVLALSWRPAQNLVSRRQLMNASFDRLHLVNTYGAFGSVTKVRYEVVVEGTADPPGGERHWQEYEFKGKPGDVTRLPRQFAPYHLRLDWLMWFAALSPAYAEPWFTRMLRALLEGDPSLRKLLRRDPFDGRPPVAVRARLFRYRFSTWGEWRHTGAWWQRTLVGDYAGPLTRR
ncbi:MAG TPA: lipase maturation factor family protein [Segeticoccus sp.]|uniref:lipase maturation factor family protein n=1 Tax=Segeticoccus sp. TaxID=2706531 RepID=UPI002D805748|nr:lipase maturation factor family protein [Segeticoccus sp.]HET8602201.1 lipase maturation factor family protein [Segeticoccus sp.]